MLDRSGADEGSQPCRFHEFGLSPFWRETRNIMTKLLLLFAFLCSLTALAQSNPPPSVTLAWNIAAGAQTNTAGYWLWQGTASSNYARALFVPGYASTNATLTNVLRGSTYYWNITALGTNSANGLESPYDGEVSATIPTPPAAPTALKIQ